MNKKVLAIIIAILIVAVAGFLLWQYKFAKTSKAPSSAAPSISPVNLGKDISNKIVNPSLPQTNPFGTQTNPFKNIYKNPFSK